MSTYYKIAVLVLRFVAMGLILWGAISALVALAMLGVAGGLGLWVIWAQPLVHLVTGIVLWLATPALAAMLARGLD
ncbi:MAG TPA: hypothetical protein VHD62_00215 [Opitutaceae bacterium]|nr:hypothetical protein [Opitutaceae bacterium]